jgi:hypothetical protein
MRTDLESTAKQAAEAAHHLVGCLVTPRPTQVNIEIRSTRPLDFGRFRTCLIGLRVIFHIRRSLCWVQVCLEFRVYVRGHFAVTDLTDLPIRLARPPPTAIRPKMLTGSRDLIGLPLVTPSTRPTLNRRICEPPFTRAVVNAHAIVWRPVAHHGLIPRVCMSVHPEVKSCSDLGQGFSVQTLNPKPLTLDPKP